MKINLWSQARLYVWMIELPDFVFANAGFLNERAEVIQLNVDVDEIVPKGLGLDCREEASCISLCFRSPSQIRSIIISIIIIISYYQCFRFDNSLTQFSLLLGHAVDV